ncbi:MAG: ABC transporter permease [Hyphomicrobiaceae bacterium]|nr:ABC transporter permease [Hyphomicrobiaceae bacterium]
MGLAAYINCFRGIVWREVLRFLHQRERFLSAMVRPLIWLFIFAAGFRQVLGMSPIPPYTTYVLYETFVTPGLVGMILLFNAMQSSLSMVYDRETGAMRTLLVSPFPRSFLLVSKLSGGVLVAMLQAYVFLMIARLWEAWTWYSPLIDAFTVSGVGGAFTAIYSNLAATLSQFANVDPLPMGYVTVMPALILSGLMLGSIALFMSSVIKQLENFAGVMNFVIFPMFFMSSALYPIWKLRESSPFLALLAELNPFTHAVELIRFALYGKLGPVLESGNTDLTHFYVVLGCTVLFLGAAIFAYNPSKGLIARRGGPGGG